MKAIITVVILALLGWGVYALMNKDEVANPSSTVEEGQNEEQGSPVSTTPVAPVVKEFAVSGKNFSFTPASMEVNVGDRVKITFTNQGGNHDLVVDGYNIRTKVLGASQSETIEFVADKAGNFEYYCSVGTHRQMGMKGTLVVK